VLSGRQSGTVIVWGEKARRVAGRLKTAVSLVTGHYLPRRFIVRSNGNYFQNPTFQDFEREPEAGSRKPEAGVPDWIENIM
jgi:hypothetical protein